MDAFSRAATNRSLRTIRTELDFLLDASVLTPAQVSQIAAILPANAASSSVVPTPAASIPAASPPLAASPPPQNEKAQQAPYSAPSPAPPAYAGPPGIAAAEALYQYNPTDAGDLALQPGERITVLEWMNADWARGRSERSGAEGIFPRAYVRVADEKAMAPPVHGMNNMAINNNGYGNMPMEVAHGQPPPQQQPGEQQGESKMNTQGKKFGKKLGNAAIFGAGATIGSNIVNGIF